ncbi:hypothetical protein FRC18_011241 [Serendipita sp. 400]|nr:hypothetical protein FRC18_011241 [Serendipita sp. 400]
MPYLSPSSSQTSTTVETDESPRLTHRRTRSATPTFSTETGPGAFTPLTGLPRRQRQFEKRPLFQIAPDDEDEQESAPSVPNGKPLNPPPESARAPERRISIAESPGTPPVSDIPFPSSVRIFFLSTSATVHSLSLSTPIAEAGRNSHSDDTRRSVFSPQFFLIHVSNLLGRRFLEEYRLE